MDNRSAGDVLGLLEHYQDTQALHRDVRGDPLWSNRVLLGSVDSKWATNGSYKLSL